MLYYFTQKLQMTRKPCHHFLFVDLHNKVKTKLLKLKKTTNFPSLNDPHIRIKEQMNF